jgi:hypothetical protein
MSATPINRLITNVETNETWGRVIPAVTPRRVVRLRENDAFGKLKQLVRTYANQQLEAFFDEKEIMNDFDKFYKLDNPDAINEWINDLFRETFVEQEFNNWSACSCHNFHQQSPDIQFTIGNFIKFWTDAEKWYNEIGVDDLGMKNEEHAWNTIAYWVFSDKLYDEYEELFFKQYKEQYSDYVDTITRKSRLTCGVCYENNILYTGCRTCNGNYLCKNCYFNLENEGECPFCRQEIMMYNDGGAFEKGAVIFNEGGETWLRKVRVLNSIIPQAVNNPVIEHCNNCNKDLRFRDKSRVIQKHLDDNEWQDLIVCLDCYKQGCH